jgi:hypothetical protein
MAECKRRLHQQINRCEGADVAGNAVASCKLIRSAVLASTLRLGTIRSDGRAWTAPV